jgi:hypothetical protein
MTREGRPIGIKKVEARILLRGVITARIKRQNQRKNGLGPGI